MMKSWHLLIRTNSKQSENAPVMMMNGVNVQSAKTTVRMEKETGKQFHRQDELKKRNINRSAVLF